MKLLETIKAIGASIKAINTKTAELDGKVTALESRNIDTTALKAEIKADIVANAPAAYDTLKEIADYIETDKTTGAALATAVGNRVRYDEAQTLTTDQKKQALANIGADDMTVDFLAKLKEAMA